MLFTGEYISLMQAREKSPQNSVRTVFQCGEHHSIFRCHAYHLIFLSGSMHIYIQCVSPNWLSSIFNETYYKSNRYGPVSDKALHARMCNSEYFYHHFHIFWLRPCFILNFDANTYSIWQSGHQFTVIIQLPFKGINLELNGIEWDNNHVSECSFL